MAAKKSPSGIHIKKKNVGKLRKKLGTPKGKNIPLSELKAKLAAAKKAGNTALIKRIVFALNSRKWSHK